VKKVPIFAKPMSEPDGIVQEAREPWKTKQFAKKAAVKWCTNVVSVGDGASERAATMTMIDENKKDVAPESMEARLRGSKKFCKSLKLKGSPTMGQLIEELCLLQKRFESVVKFEGDLDLRAYFGQLGCGPTSFVYNTHLDADKDSTTTGGKNTSTNNDTDSETENPGASSSMGMNRNGPLPRVEPQDLDQLEASSLGSGLSYNMRRGLLGKATGGMLGRN
jgi:hypothetical protein